MLNLQEFFGENIGKIVISKDTCTYRVDKLNDIFDIIIPHFDKYPLVTQKLADYILFKEIVNLMKNKEHLTLEGLKKILSIKASLNLGLSPCGGGDPYQGSPNGDPLRGSEELKDKFSDIQAAVKRPLIIDKIIPSPFWVAGFTTGDGSFYLTIPLRGIRQDSLIGNPSGIRASKLNEISRIDIGVFNSSAFEGYYFIGKIYCLF
uniref:LAGLIDADG endonuclease n=1 Tax=Ophiognomonia clavigignenti-juglandacearum TaxID=218668 RepID=A0A2C9DSC4_9PEZI|nr:LAGLIDADG endonuclease [Ophiognomonia clavigignenti-juglandacearum]